MQPLLLTQWRKVSVQQAQEVYTQAFPLKEGNHLYTHHTMGTGKRTRKVSRK